MRKNSGERRRGEELPVDVEEEVQTKENGKNKKRICKGYKKRRD